MDDFQTDNFDDMNLKQELLRGIYFTGYEKPSAIQQKTIMPIISGRDTIVHARSGTGKTVAFIIGALQRIDTTINRCQAMVIVPTRELASGICLLMQSLGKFMGVTAHAVTGGTAMQGSYRVLEQGVQVVIGTAGRLQDLVNRMYLQPSYLRMLIIDEVDEVWSRGFEPHIRELMIMLPPDTQILVLSATLPREVLQLTEQFMRSPITSYIRDEEKTLEGIKQYYVLVEKEDWKREVLYDLLEGLDVSQLVIYVNKSSKSEEVAALMTERHYQVAVVNSTMGAISRTSAEMRFRTGEVRYLIKTDLHSESQHNPLVIQYDLPSILEIYLKRIGRSGCYGSKGVSIALVTDREVDQLKEIQTFYNTSIEELPVDLSEVL
jgi:translation initiation factor 4A